MQRKNHAAVSGSLCRSHGSFIVTEVDKKTKQAASFCLFTSTVDISIFNVDVRVPEYS